MCVTESVVDACVFGGWEDIEIAMKVTEMSLIQRCSVCSCKNVSLHLLLIVWTKVSVIGSV